MPDADDVALVRKAILSSTTGDCEWSVSASRRMRSDISLSGLTEGGVKTLLQEYVPRVVR